MKFLVYILAIVLFAVELHAQNPIPNMRINDDPSGAKQGAARIALDRNGTIYVAWTDFRSNNKGDIYLSKSTDGGTTFSANKAVYTGGTVQSGMERGVTMAIDSMGGIHMVWMEASRSSVPELRYIRSTDGGATFSHPVYIGGPSGISAQDFPSMGIDAGNNLYVAWVDDRELRAGTGTNVQIYFMRSADRGLTFSAPMRVSKMPGGIGGSCECCNTGMAVSPSGHIYISFRSNIKNRRDVFVARSLNGGESFETAMPAASEQWMLDACPMSGSAVALDEDETAHIVWRDVRPSVPGQGYIYHAMLFYEATACTPDTRLSTSLVRSNFPAIAITSDGGIICSFQGDRDNVSDAVSVYSFDGGNSFTTASKIADDPKASSRLEPIMVVGADGTRYTVWTDARRDAGDIYFVKDSRPLTLVKPDRVSLLLPANAATIKTFQEFSWSVPANLADARNVSYDLTIVKDGSPTVVKDIRANSYRTTLSPGSYSWNVVAHTPAGRSEASETFSFMLTSDQGAGVPNATVEESLVLHDAFVSSAGDEVRISFGLRKPETVTLSVIGIDGVRRMISNPRTYGAGEQSATLDIRSLASGVYLLELRSSSGRQVRKFTVAR
jgi:hypothetical protein